MDLSSWCLVVEALYGMTNMENHNTAEPEGLKEITSSKIYCKILMFEMNFRDI